MQYAGHPIANDMLYLSKHVTDRSTQGVSADKAAVCSEHSLSSGFDQNSSDANGENSIEDFSIDPMCTNCPNLAPKG